MCRVWRGAISSVVQLRRLFKSVGLLLNAARLRFLLFVHFILVAVDRGDLG